MSWNTQKSSRVLDQNTLQHTAAHCNTLQRTATHLLLVIINSDCLKNELEHEEEQLRAEEKNYSRPVWGVRVVPPVDDYTYVYICVFIRQIFSKVSSVILQTTVSSGLI